MHQVGIEYAVTSFLAVKEPPQTADTPLIAGTPPAATSTKSTRGASETSYTSGWLVADGSICTHSTKITRQRRKRPKAPSKETEEKRS